MTSAPAVAAPVQVASLVAVEAAMPPLQPSQIALDAHFGAVDVALLSSSADAPQAPNLPLAADAPSQPAPGGERALIEPEVSLNSPYAFDADPDWSASYASLVAPAINAPRTPDMNVDPTAVAAPLDALSDAPHARTPELTAPAVVAVLGAEPPAGFSAVSQPDDLAVDYTADAGRDEARAAVLNAAAEGGWRRYAVAPPANPNNLPVLAIVIDEIGAYGAPVDEVAALSPMVSTSVIPSTPDAAGIVETLRASGREVLVHMPMETYADFKEGPKAIEKSMTDEEVRETARWHLSQFTGFVGVNNHLGSKVTRDPRIMGALMAELSQRGLLFIDSRTTTKSIAEQVAHDAGLLASRNNRFIDNELSVEAIMRELSAAAAYARNHGAGIALGNPNPVTVRAVKQWMELNDGKTVLVAPITHVTSVINAKAEQVVASK